MALPETASLARVEFPHAILLLIAAGLLPLFPLHWIYVTALTRLPRYGAILAAIALPAGGLYVLAHAGSEIPFGIRQALGTLALCGVLYEIIKALAQRRLPQLIAFGGCAFYSIFWWCLSSDRYDQGMQLYAMAATLVIAALLFAVHLAQARIGDAALDRMHGLARPMPRFATLFAVIVMAAVGLFPFGFFSTYVEMVASSARTLSWALAMVLLSWYVSSWYFFRMMQRLLFGPHRSDLRCEDLRTGEAAVIAALLILTAALSFIPRSWFDDRALARASFVEWAAWRK
jgi:NADH-quinone oxidoreductase subunit M